MFTPFSFQFNVPGIRNPFSAPAAATNVNDAPSHAPRPIDAPAHRPDVDSSYLSRPRRRRPSPASLSPSQPTCKKRGWTPSFAEPSETILTSSRATGWVDSPAKYRDMADIRNDNHGVEEMVGDLPPAKRRRTLAGSIVSTALSAALIGTAVGLTVYRLWRDRGKTPDALPPPPPYQQGDWVPVGQQAPEPPTTKVTPPTPRRKPRQALTVGRNTTRHRKTRSHNPLPATPPHSAPAHISHFPAPPQPEFNFPDEEPTEEDEEMDWIGGKLSQLIEEGKKALGREIVVMSEAPEDEVDDATGDWQEEEPENHAGPSSASRRGSIRRRNAPPVYAGTLPRSASPRKSQFGTLTPPGRSRGTSVDADRSSSSFKESEQDWQSDHLREFMERARASKRR